MSETATAAEHEPAIQSTRKQAQVESTVKAHFVFSVTSVKGHFRFLSVITLMEEFASAHKLPPIMKVTTPLTIWIALSFTLIWGATTGQPLHEAVCDDEAEPTLERTLRKHYHEKGHAHHLRTHDGDNFFEERSSRAKKPNHVKETSSGGSSSDSSRSSDSSPGDGPHGRKKCKRLYEQTEEMWASYDVLSVEGFPFDKVTFEVASVGIHKTSFRFSLPYQAKKEKTELIRLVEGVPRQQPDHSVPYTRTLLINAGNVLPSCSNASPSLHLTIPDTVSELCVGRVCRPVVCPLYLAHSGVDPSAQFSYSPSNNPLYFGESLDCDIVKPELWDEFVLEYLADTSNIDPPELLYYADPDGDGASNIIEYYGIHPMNTSAAIEFLEEDISSEPVDESSNRRKLSLPRLMTHPRKADTNSDGLPDGYKLRYGLKAPKNDLFEDIDGDGLRLIDEYYLKTDPKKADSDGDGVSDGVENKEGTDPLDDRDFNARDDATCASYKTCRSCQKSNDCYWSQDSKKPTGKCKNWWRWTGRDECACDLCENWAKDEIADATWVNDLPVCPCTVKSNALGTDIRPKYPDGVSWGDDWACSENGLNVVNFFVNCEYHKGRPGEPSATACIRAKKKTYGQQCCYYDKEDDGNYKFIKPGFMGAGTPDRSTKLFGRNSHNNLDVKTYTWCCLQCPTQDSCNRYIGGKKYDASGKQIDIGARSDPRGCKDAVTPSPSSTPSLETPDPTLKPTPSPSPDPTRVPTPDPSPDPTPEPTSLPTPDPTPDPTLDPTPSPTPDPTPDPALEPTPLPTTSESFSASPSDVPTSSPTAPRPGPASGAPTPGPATTTTSPPSS